MYLFFLFVFLFTTCGLFSGDEKKYIVLPEVVITATRINQMLFDVSKPGSLISNGDEEMQKALMMNEVLDETPGVFLQKTTAGHGTPIIRGFIGRENLVLIDGIRLNNSTLRSGPVQYLNTVDNFLVDKIEVIRGPGSSLYGSDSLGGVLNIIGKNPVSQNVIGLKSISRVDTASNGVASRVELDGKLDKISYLFGGTYKNIGNLRAGGDYGVLTPTGFNEQDADGKIIYNISKEAAVTLNYQFTRQNEVPRYDSYKGSRMFTGAGTYQKYLYDPQERHLGWLKYEQQKLCSWLDSLSLTASFHRQLEGRVLQKVAKTVITEYSDRVDTIGFAPQLTSIIDNHRLVYGFEYYNDYVESRYWDHNTITDVRTENALNSTFPDGSKYNTAGVFLSDEWQLSETLKIAPEIRYSRMEYASTIRNNPSVGEISGIFQNITGAFGVTYKVLTGVNLCGNISQGFRAPNLDDLVTLRVENQGIDVPNYDIRPEKNTNIEVGVKGEIDKLSWSAFYYFSDAIDKIERKAGTYEGVTTIGGVPVYQKFNIGKSQTQGVELNGRYYFDELLHLSVAGNLTWTEGRNLVDAEPLSRIPPLNGLLSVRYEVPEWGLEAYTRFADRQNRLSARDKTDTRMDPTGTASWYTLNIRGNIKISDALRINAGVENILDRGYRIHSSGVDAAGRNVFLSVEAKIY
jgi:outer membrane receptor protein involved in Fe transport